eukprot:CAMPEP_0195271134 /NCGR_PEP_ID=MMETSP0706-20130129/14838_1 /TAXON_ID=33640 /ORGANISM="Asterionellopsis glacialis, Strain CCMP134" /LENGTH=111 /DNA_ID=CAMNT_0040326685 /DNA_START=274 /DNA_END=609 /DNA_ORIENTATION=+
MPLEQDAQSKRTFEFAQSGFHGRNRIRPAIEMRRNQVRDGLGISFGLECVSLFLEGGAQMPEILDDAIVHECNRAGDMRVGVLRVGSAVRRPSRMTDADGSADRVVLQQSL